MLDVLRRITQEVNHARDLGHALEIIVLRIKDAMSVDVCSVYLLDHAAGCYTLMATDGLNPQAVGAVSLQLGQGLVSLVGERAEPVNTDDASQHPRYQYIAETDEAPYHAFLGVPIIHHRKVLGVLIVQQRVKRLFDEQEVSFLLTVGAQLSGAIAHAEASGASPHNANVASETPLEGLPGAPGVAMGVGMVVYPQADLDAVPDRSVTDVDAEVDIFREAVALAQADIKGLHARLSAILSAEDQALFDAYLQMLGSSSIADQVIARIREGSWASGALRDTIADHVRIFEAMDDPYMRDRAQDVRDLGRRILMCLQKTRVKPPPYPDATLLIGEEISATVLAEVPTDKLVGVISARGSSSSHVAILARALGVPAVVGVKELPINRLEGRELIADGYSGRIYVSPSDMVREEYIRLAKEEDELAAGLSGLRDLPAQTRDGFRLPLYANTGLLSDITPSLRCGAEGIGLYRTEFPFMIRDCFPSEEEQFRIYSKAVEVFSPRPVVLRTLDVGGDKSLPYFPIVEDNPFLGWRGIRITLDHPELFMVQLRAMLRAGVTFENLRLLLPMVSTLSELDDALALLDKAVAELQQEGLAVQRPPVGVMVEVPSMAYQIEAAAQRVDFISVGTNDLTQYLLAVDRNNSSVAGLYDSLNPAVIRCIKQIVDDARRHGCPVSVCGEMAGDPRAALLLLGMGVDSLSMSASSLLRVKWVVREFTQSAAQALLAQALTLNDVAAVRDLLTQALSGAGLGGLIRAGK